MQGRCDASSGAVPPDPSQLKLTLNAEGLVDAESLDASFGAVPPDLSHFDLILNSKGAVIDCEVDAEFLGASPGAAPPDPRQVELTLYGEGLVIECKADAESLDPSSGAVPPDPNQLKLTLNAEGLVIDCKVHAESLDASPGVVPPDLSQLELILNSKGLVIDFKGDYTKLISSDKGKNVLKKTDLHVACKNVVVQYQASKASSALIFLALFVAFSLVLFGACLGRHPEGARKKITEHAPVAEFMPKHGRLASECLEKSEEFFICLSDWVRYYTLSC